MVIGKLIEKRLFENSIKGKKYLKKGSKVLTPGSGLGRLVLEFVAAGFGCQGNQVTYFMLYGSNFILNAASEKQQYKIYPFIHTMDYHYDDDDIFRSILVPDKVACECVPEDADFSMAAGQFTEVYNKCPEQFDCVASCFFIDTANNVFEYIDTIYKTLKPGGYWINFGRCYSTTENLSWQMLRKYIQKRFQFVEQEMIKTTYCHDPKSDLTIRYNCLMFVCIKK